MYLKTKICKPNLVYLINYGFNYAKYFHNIDRQPLL